MKIIKSYCKRYDITVDDDDYERLQKYNWSVVDTRGYVRATSHGTTIGRVILRYRGPLLVDHIDRNGLNNQKANLRLATNNQSVRNRKTADNTITGYRGVYRSFGGKYVATIAVDNKRKHLGTFDTAELAAKAYDEAARYYHGEFAVLNFPD